MVQLAKTNEPGRADRLSTKKLSVENRPGKRSEPERKNIQIEIVQNDPATPWSFNAHTHGLESLGHPDLQIVYPLGIDVAAAILEDAAAEIRKGARFEEGKISKKILAEHVPVNFLKVSEGGRSVLRIILPDESYCVEEGKMENEYARQYEHGPRPGKRKKTISLSAFKKQLKEVLSFPEVLERPEIADLLARVDPLDRQDVIIHYDFDGTSPRAESAAFRQKFEEYCSSKGLDDWLRAASIALGEGKRPPPQPTNLPEPINWGAGRLMDAIHDMSQAIVRETLKDFEPDRKDTK